MLLDQRRQNILQIVEREGFVSVHRLVDELQASEATVRRDLEALERDGQIRRTRGGASFVGESLAAFDERSQHFRREKVAVGRVAAALVNTGDAVLLDGGSTTLEVARNLVGKSLLVVTNSIPIVNLLGNVPQIELIQVGGYVYPKTGVALGPLAVAAIKSLRVRRLFMSVGGITADGLFNSNSLLVETERSMLDAAEEVIVVTDSSKLGRTALAHLCSLDRVHRLVVDDGLSAEWRRTLESAGVDIVTASTGIQSPQQTE